MITFLQKRPWIYGIPKEKPKLPDGFTLVESERTWLMARGPDGRLWYVQGHKLVASREYLPLGRTKMKRIADTTETIPLPL